MLQSMEVRGANLSEARTRQGSLCGRRRIARSRSRIVVQRQAGL